MEGLIILIIICVIVFFVNERNKKKKYRQNLFNYYLYQNNQKNNNHNKTPDYNNPGINENQKNKAQYDIRTAYKKTKLLTDNEKQYYNVLAPYAEKNNLHLLSKIRLADLITVDKKSLKRNIDVKISFSKISSKHIDFALCNKTDLEPILLIEVDDYTHNRPDRIERDKFIDSTLRGAGYKIIHITTPIDLEKHLDYLTAAEKN